MFRLMLTCHPLIEVAPESGFMLWWYDKYSSCTPLYQNANEESIDSFLKDLFSSKKIEFWNLDRSLLKASILSNKPKSYAELVSLIYKQYATQQGKSTLKYWGDKNNYYIKHIDQLIQLYPNAQFLHLVRDGRDVATSYLNMSKIKSDSMYAPNLPKDIESIATEWNDNNTLASKSLETLPSNRWHLVRYEDLVTKPQSTLTSVCDALQLEYHHSMLEFHHANLKKNLEPKDFMAWKAKTFKKIDTKSIGKYKTELKSTEIEQFEKTAYSSLKKYAYL